MKRQVYLDYAAATPVDKAVIKAMLPYFQDEFFNPSALYLASKKVKTDLGAARERVAKVLGVRPAEVVFTAGGTEANNLAIQGIMRQFPNGRIIVSAVEHDSVLRVAERYNHAICPVTREGRIDMAQLAKMIDDETVLVSVMHVNNELGTIQPLSDIVSLIKDVRNDRLQRRIRTPLLIHTDASQSANYLKLQPHKLGVDSMTINGGKMYGPKQTGVLFVASGTPIQPLLLGGGQERNLRSGTENVAGSIGFSVALEKAQSRAESERMRVAKLQEQFVHGIAARFPDAVINSNGLVNFVHVTFPGADNERLVMELDERGIQCAVGSACSASSDEPSHVLTAISLSDADAQSSVRFTMGRGTTETDITYVIQQLRELLA